MSYNTWENLLPTAVEGAVNLNFVMVNVRLLVIITEAHRQAGGVRLK